MFRRLKIPLSRLCNSLLAKLLWYRKPGRGQATKEWAQAREEFWSLKSELENSRNAMIKAGDSLRREAVRLGLAPDESALLRHLEIEKSTFDWRIRPLIKRLHSLFGDTEGFRQGGGHDYKRALQDFSRKVSDHHEQFKSTRSRLELARELLLKYGNQGAFDSILPLTAALDAPEFVAAVCRASEERLRVQSELVPLLRSSVDSRLEICRRRISLISECKAASGDDIARWRQRLSEFKDAEVAAWDNGYNDLLSLQDRLDPFIQELEDFCQEVVTAQIHQASQRGWEILRKSDLIRQKGRKARGALLSLQKPYQESSKSMNTKRRSADCLKTVSNLKKIITTS